MSIESIEARLAKATPGKWVAEDAGISEAEEGYIFAAESFRYGDCDAEFAAHAHQDIPLLLAVAKAAAGLVRLTGCCDIEYEDEFSPRLYPMLNALNAALADLERGE